MLGTIIGTTLRIRMMDFGHGSHRDASFFCSDLTFMCNKFGFFVPSKSPELTIPKVLTRLQAREDAGSRYKYMKDDPEAVECAGCLIDRQGRLFLLYDPIHVDYRKNIHYMDHIQKLEIPWNKHTIVICSTRANQYTEAAASYASLCREFNKMPSSDEYHRCTDAVLELELNGNNVVNLGVEDVLRLLEQYDKDHGDTK